MRFDHIVPMNDLIDRPELFNSSFNLSEEPFNFPVGLGVFHPCNDVFDAMMIQEILERVLREFPVPDRNELGTVVCQDLARGSVFTEPLGQDGDGVLGCRRIEHSVAGDQPG